MAKARSTGKPKSASRGAKPAGLDLRKLHADQYVAPKQPVTIDVPPGAYLAVDGAGAPGGDEFVVKVGALYGMAFTLKFQSKAAGQDYKVCHLEGLYWADEPIAEFVSLPRDQWRWKLLIRVPDFIGPDDLEQAKAALREKHKPPEFEGVRLETVEEGRCVQALHVGPYADEPATIERMRLLAADSGLAFRGRHHEIYLSDPRRVAPERLRTILRIPVRPHDQA